MGDDLHVFAILVFKKKHLNFPFSTVTVHGNVFSKTVMLPHALVGFKAGHPVWMVKWE